MDDEDCRARAGGLVLYKELPEEAEQRSEKDRLMALKRVDIYWLGYSRTKKKLYCYFLLHGEGTLRQIYPTPAEFIRLARQLEGEGPVAYNTVGRYFVSTSEGKGETEPHHQIGPRDRLTANSSPSPRTSKSPH